RSAPRRARGRGRRDSDRVPAGVSGGRHRLRRSRRSRQPGVAGEPRAARLPRARRARHAPQRHVSHQSEERMRVADQRVHRLLPFPASQSSACAALSRITDDVALPLDARPGAGWAAAFAVAAAALLVGVGCVSYEIATGIGVWGLNRTVGWAFDITNFVFWVGIGHAGTLISAILLLFRQQRRTLVHRSGAAVAHFPRNWPP